MSNIDSMIDGSDKLTGIFGSWPSFHDAEVIELYLERGNALAEQKNPHFPILTVKIHLWDLTSEVDVRGHYVLRNHTLATLRFHDVLDLKIEGFNQQNAINELSITVTKQSSGPWKQTFAVEFKPAFGIDAVFQCSCIEVVEAVPWH